MTNCWRRNLLAMVLWWSLPAIVFAQWYAATGDFLEEEPLTPAQARERSGWTIEVGGRDGEWRRLYLDGELLEQERTTFVTSDAGISLPRQILRSDAQDELLFRVELRYRSDGTLRSIRRCGNDGSCVMIRYAPPGGPGTETIRGDGLNLTVRYGEGSVPEYLRREEPGEPVEEEWYRYLGGRLVERRTLRDGLETLLRYQEGVVVLEEQRQAGVLVYRFSEDRGNDGLPLQRVVETRGRREVDRYHQEHPEGLQRERFVNGALVEREYLRDEEVVVERLRGEEVLFRTYFVEGELVRRETLLRDKVIDVEIPGE